MNTIWAGVSLLPAGTIACERLVCPPKQKSNRYQPTSTAAWRGFMIYALNASVAAIVQRSISPVHLEETVVAADLETWNFASPSQPVHRGIVNAQIRSYFLEGHNRARRGSVANMGIPAAARACGQN